jgi:hypothetical protein
MNRTVRINNIATIQVKTGVVFGSLKIRYNGKKIKYNQQLERDAKQDLLGALRGKDSIDFGAMEYGDVIRYQITYHYRIFQSDKLYIYRDGIKVFEDTV